MSIGNVPAELQRAEWPAPSTTPVKVINVRNNATGKYSGSTACLLVYGADGASTALISSGVAGFLSGCIWIETSGAAGVQMYINQGTLSSSSFISIG